MAHRELLAPAGQPDAGYAALHYGADAVYLGLAEFSARAEAVNFTPPELERFVAYAHSLTPRRKVYLALNTLVKNDELARAADILVTATQCGVDALIVQDLGIARLARENFPHLELHASTQMAIHNVEGAQAVRNLGFRRVTLARELTLPEIAAICRDGGVEVETFIHGTLCYSYSGLCLFSSIRTGRSGNRGRCVYTCREGADTPVGRMHPFSLKDMALGSRVLDLAKAGVASFKIEGRKKSPLYVAATVDYYRRILDGAIRPDDAAEYEARLQTIFARPWTTFFLDSRHNPAAADTGVVGHRGAPLGTITRLARTPAGPGIVFTPCRALERHDGIQVDVPGSSRPFGFAVDNLYAVRGGRLESSFALPGGGEAAVALPGDAPNLTPGLPVYQSSSQKVKRSYPYDTPRSDTPESTLAMDVAVNLTRDDKDEARCRLVCTALAPFPSLLWGKDRQPPLLCTVTETLDAFPARDAAGSEKAALDAFRRTGGSRFRMGEWLFVNPDNLYVRPGEWNRLRRELLAGLEKAFLDRVEERRQAVAEFVAADFGENFSAQPADSVRWSIVVDRPAQLSAFSDTDWEGVAEVIVNFDAREEELNALAARVGRDRVRLATPLLARDGAMQALADRIAVLRRSGWSRWLIGGVGMLRLFDREVFAPADLAADWPLYVMNHEAAEAVLALGMSSFTLSPEDDAANIGRLVRAYPGKAWVLAHAELPLFVSAACVHGHVGRCRRGGGGKCTLPGSEAMALTLEKSGPVVVVPQRCGSVALAAEPYSLSSALEKLAGMGAGLLRVDLRWRGHDPTEAAEVWRAVRGGRFAGGSVGNFYRGLA